MEIQTQNLKILVVDDDPSSVEILAYKLNDLNLANELTHFEDGQRALDYLQDKVLRSAGAREDLPDLIILDIYLPRLKGMEILKILKADAVLRVIPVLVMTVSERPTDILDTYKYGGVAFISKFEEAAVLGKALRQMRVFGMIPSTPTLS